MNKLLKIIILLSCFSYLYAQNTVNVGIYQNKPKVFMDKNNVPKGFFVDILNEIAIMNNLQLNYVPCDWAECLNQLKQNKIDIMPDVAYTLKREKDFLFSNEPVLSSWSLLYKNKDVKIEHIFDLENKKIAVMKNSIQANKIKDILHKYGVENSLIIEVDSFSEAFELVRNHKADCTLSNRFYELNNNLSSDIVKTNILIEPSVLKFAFSKKSHYLINTIDNGLVELKKDKKSIFYIAKENWITPKQKQTIPKWILWSLVISLGVILVLIFLVYLFRKMVKIKSQELLKKEQIILLQSKNAAMGEMLGNIAHQWRQPLSAISTAATGSKMQKEMDCLDDTQFFLAMDTINNSAQYLSQTIDDFRNFFNPGSYKEKEFTISGAISKTLHLINAQFTAKEIEVVENIEDYKIKSIENELIQVLINILNNARDILITKENQRRLIFINAYKKDDISYIEILDNAGGIEEDIVDRIFEPYFTTKHQSQGTGIGLYMSENIIYKHLHGNLVVSNEVYTYEDVEYTGAKFIISIPY